MKQPPLQDDLIPLSDFLDFALTEYRSYGNMAEDLLHLLKDHDIPLYKKITEGFRPRIGRYTNISLKHALQSIKNNNGYYCPFDDDIPF